MERQDLNQGQKLHVILCGPLEKTERALLQRGDAEIKEALIKSTCADLRQKFLLTRKKIAGILTDFKIF
nr:hypothetical protein [uncultured Oscillibacter sp.]